MKEAKVRLITVLLIITMIVIVSIITVLYFLTDMFKSSETLFKKYVGQNLEDIGYIFNIGEEESSFDILQDKDYSENADITLSYLEKEDDKEEIFEIQEDGVIENEKDKSYRNIKVSYNDEEISRIEFLKEDELYGFRLANIVQQFVSIKNENLPYFISSLGYNGDYFSEKLSKTDISGLFNFSTSELRQLASEYVETIFKDINTNSYSTKHNSMITLSNGKSVTATAHVLSINQNDFDKIYKRVLNKAAEDTVILSKLDELDAKISEVGFIEPEGESIKERYVQKLKSIADNIQYSGTDESKIVINVYEIKGDVVRLAVKTTSPSYEYILDCEDTEGKTLTLQIGKLTNEGEDVQTYKLNKNVDTNGYTRNLIYENKDETLEINMKTTVGETQMQVTGELNYKNNNIYSLNAVANANVTFSTGNTSQISFNDNNNIILNNYEGSKIPGILEGLEDRFVNKLETSQSKINSKLLNNIIVWFDNVREKREEDKKNKDKDKMEAFNNQFVLYAGENLQYSHVQKLMEVVGNNMSAYKALSGTKIRMAIKEGVENQTKAATILGLLDARHTYNIIMHKSKDGYIQYIDLEVYKKPEN